MGTRPANPATPSPNVQAGDGRRGEGQLSGDGPGLDAAPEEVGEEGWQQSLPGTPVTSLIP